MTGLGTRAENITITITITVNGSRIAKMHPHRSDLSVNAAHLGSAPVTRMCDPVWFENT